MAGRRKLSPRAQRWSERLSLGTAVFVHGLMIWISATAIHDGLRYDAMRTASGAVQVTVIVDHIEPICSKGCVYRSSGHYLDAGGGAHAVTVEPNYQHPNRGPLQAVVSPSFGERALQAGYTGAGLYWFAAVLLAIPLIVDSLVTGAVLTRRRRRRQVAAALAAEPGAHPVEFNAILHGPGTSNFAPAARLTLYDAGIYAPPTANNATVRIAPADVTAVSVSDEPIHTGGVPLGDDWSTVVLTTARGDFYLTCQRDYVPLVRRAFEPKP